jgi:hypothetical protein
VLRRFRESVVFALPRRCAVARSRPSPKSARTPAHSTTLFKRLSHSPPAPFGVHASACPAESETGGGDTLKRGHQAEILWITTKSGLLSLAREVPGPWNLFHIPTGWLLHLALAREVFGWLLHWALAREVFGWLLHWALAREVGRLLHWAAFHLGPCPNCVVKCPKMR